MKAGVSPALPGSNVEDVVIIGSAQLEGIALDRAASKMYWTDAEDDTIRRANLDGSGIEDLVTLAERSSLRGIALDVPFCIDGDFDGYGLLGDPSCPNGSAQDCDDTDNMFHPGATEVPGDGIDQDCNGFDTITCFEDSDGDGFGSTATLLAADGDCIDPGESVVDTDCDDNDANTFPGATEVCNAKDNNCNGILDDDQDSDGDGVSDCVDQCAGVDDAVYAPGCSSAIPTISLWGLVVLTLLLLVAGKLFFGLHDVTAFEH